MNAASPPTTGHLTTPLTPHWPVHPATVAQSLPMEPVRMGQDAASVNPTTPGTTVIPAPVDSSTSPTVTPFPRFPPTTTEKPNLPEKSSTVSAVQQVPWITPADQTPEPEPASVNQVSVETTVTPVLQGSTASIVRPVSAQVPAA